MKISAAVSEYNPYHNGHKYLTDYARNNGSDYFIAIMSGNVVQRGELAVTDKFTRARAAVPGGVDLVIELPCIYSLASAERFAYGAVKTLDLCGCIDSLYFGAECGDIDLLSSAAKAVSDTTVFKRIKELSGQGCSHPRAASIAVKELAGDKYAAVLNEPNNTLAIEYIKALRSLSSSIKPIAVMRQGVGHNDIIPNGEYASASLIRDKIISNDNSYNNYLPDTVSEIIANSIEKGECPARIHNNERGFLQALRRLSEEEWKNVPHTREGLENRIYKAVRECNLVSEIIDRVKCKRYTYARISRALMCAYFGITKEIMHTEPQYIRVLAMNKRGTDLLGEISKNADVPVITSPARDINKLNAEGRRLFELECRVSDMYSLFTPSVQKCGLDYTQRIFTDK